MEKVGKVEVHTLISERRGGFDLYSRDNEEIPGLDRQYRNTITRDEAIAHMLGTGWTHMVSVGGDDRIVHDTFTRRVTDS